MTGFGKSTTEIAGKKITVEIKSLNSKQMDLNVRMPALFRHQEIELRNLVAHELERGKADMSVTLESVGSAITGAHVNSAVIAAYKAQIEALSADLGIPEPADWYNVLMRMPDVMTQDTTEEASPELSEALTSTVKAAVEELRQHRRAEGERLEEFFAARIKGIADLIPEVEKYEGERLVRIRTRMEDALSKVPVADYDKGRLEQEMIFYIEKLDVNEEKQRLRQHLRYFIDTLENPAGGQGKKLGFIALEMGIEINTLGSKSNHAEMQEIVVKMKDLLEQIKEQVLNVL